MHDFLIREIITSDITGELLSTGFDSSYAPKAAWKYLYKNLKIYNLSPAQANILKQTALSAGADCAAHREVITGKIDYSNCILGGSLAQFKVIAAKLQCQPFGLKFLAQKLLDLSDFSHHSSGTKIVGILNITKDSFSDGGRYYDYEASVEHLNELITAGADIIDIGAESTKPYSNGVSSDEQLDKLLPVLKYIESHNINIPISIDTRSSIVAEECIKCGASIINDVSGLDFDSNMADVIAKYPETKAIIQHSKGTPENMQISPQYDDLMEEIFIQLYNKVEFAQNKGIRKDNIIIDPGIGFGKLKRHNIEIINRWKELKTIGCPVMIGLSRKSLLECKDAVNEEKDIYTLALNSILINSGIDFIRVHNPALHKKFMSILG